MRLNFIKLICLGITIFQASLLSGLLTVQAAEPLPIEPPATTSVGPLPSDQQWSPDPIGPQPTPPPQPTPHSQATPPWRQGNNPLTHRDMEHLARGVGYERDDKILHENLRANGFEHLDRIDNKETGLQAVLIRDNRALKNPQDKTSGGVYVVFRGTEFTVPEDRMKDLKADVGSSPRPTNMLSHPIGKEQYETDRAKLKEWSEQHNGNITVTGHSLAGALGQRFVADSPDAVQKAVFFNSPGIDAETAKTITKDELVGPDGKSKITYYGHPRDPVSLGGEKHLFGDVYEVEGGPTETFNPGSLPLAEHRGDMLEGNTAIEKVDFDKWQADISGKRVMLTVGAIVAEEVAEKVVKEVVEEVAPIVAKKVVEEVNRRLNPPSQENSQPTPPPNPLPKAPQKTQPQEVKADPTPPPKPVPDIEEEKRRIAKEEARLKAVEEAIKKAAEERRKAEEEARQKAAEEERQKAVEEAKRKMEEANKKDNKTNIDVVGDNRGVGGPEGVDNPEGKPEVGADELYTDEDSVKKLRGAEKKTTKLDKSKKKSAKGEKEGIELAKGINVTDSFDKERSGKSKNESQEAQTGAGTTLSERAGASKSQHEREKGKIDAQGQETDRAISETHKEHTTAQQTAQQERQTSIGTTIAEAVAGGLTSGVATGLDNFFGGVGRGAGQQTSSDIGIVKKSKKGQGPSPSGSNTTAGTGTASQTPPAQGTGSGTKTQDQPGPEVKPDNKDRGGSTGGTTAGSGKEKGGSSGVKSGGTRKATCKCDESSCGCNKPARICSLMDASECKTKTVIKTSPGTGTTTGTKTTGGTSTTSPGNRPGRFSGEKTVKSFP